MNGSEKKGPQMLYDEAVSKIKSGRKNIKEGHNDEAAEDFNEALRLLDEDRTLTNSDKACWFYYNRGLANLMLKNFEEAKSNFIQAINCKNNDVAVFFYTLSLANLELGHSREAIDKINAAIEILESGRNQKENENQHPADYYHARGVIYKLKGDYDAALDDLLKAKRMRKQDEKAAPEKERVPSR